MPSKSSSSTRDDGARGSAPGHEPGHSSPGIGWRELVEPLVSLHGGWAALADELVRRSREGDVFTVEKGLRRLSRRGHQDGGRYGRLVLRHFGAPPAIESWARWLGQFHGRFTDLPSSLRIEQLRVWDRPPISEGRVGAWIDVGLASAHHRRGELDECTRRMARARTLAERHESDAVIETALFEARLEADDDRYDDARRTLDRVERAIDAHAAAITPADRLCYRARLLGQRAFMHTRPRRGEALDLHQARALFLAIEEIPGVPFAAFRRAAGLAYCTWKLGDPVEGARLAELAAEHAGDGGFIRFRVMALSLLSRMVAPERAREIVARTERMARALEDDELVRRTERDAVLAGR